MLQLATKNSTALMTDAFRQLLHSSCSCILMRTSSRFMPAQAPGSWPASMLWWSSRVCRKEQRRHGQQASLHTCRNCAKRLPAGNLSCWPRFLLGAVQTDTVTCDSGIVYSTCCCTVAHESTTHPASVLLLSAAAHLHGLPSTESSWQGPCKLVVREVHEFQ